MSCKLSYSFVSKSTLLYCMGFLLGPKCRNLDLKNDFSIKLSPILVLSIIRWYEFNIVKYYKYQRNFQQKRYETVRELLRSMNILNVYQINILNNTILIHQISKTTAPSVFLSKFKKPSHMHPTRFSNVNYIKPTYKLNRMNF